MKIDAAFFRSRFAIFPAMGLGIGLLFALRALLGFGAAAATGTSSGFVLSALLLAYVVGGTLAGLLVAVAFPLVRRSVGGAFLVGTLAMLPLYMGIALADKEGASGENLAVAAVCSVLVGGVAGASIWYREHRRSYRLAHLWIFTLVSSGVASFVGLRWAGELPAMLASVLLIGSVMLALIVTIERLPRARN